MLPLVEIGLFKSEKVLGYFTATDVVALPVVVLVPTMLYILDCIVPLFLLLFFADETEFLPV